MNSKMMPIPLTETTIDEAEVEAVAKVIRSKWLTMGGEVSAFEEEFAATIGCRYGIAVANGTVALHLAYQGVGLGAADEFCIPALTFIATLHAGVYLGARPVLIDIESEDDLTMSVADLKRKISKDTKLIVTMPYGGFSPDMDAICDVARSHGIPVVEDACHGPLAACGRTNVGTFGLASTWSFYGNKNLTTGEGGMILTNDIRLADRLRSLRSHGMSSSAWDRRSTSASNSYNIEAVGYNYRLDELHGAIGRVQLNKLHEATERRQTVDRKLREALMPAVKLGLKIPFGDPRGRAAHHLFVVLLPRGVNRDEFRERIDQQRIQTSMHYPLMHRYPHLKNLLANTDVPILEALHDRLVTLPMGPSLTDDHIAYIAESVTSSIQQLL